MNKSKVLKVDLYCKYADIELLQDFGKIKVVYNICLPESSVVKSERSGKVKPVLSSGDEIKILRDNVDKQDIAYLYNGRMYLVVAPKDCRDFVRKLSLSDRVNFARALRGEVLRNKQIPSFMDYKNLQKIIKNKSMAR